MTDTNFQPIVIISKSIQLLLEVEKLPIFESLKCP